jgi:hypothetical protein
MGLRIGPGLKILLNIVVIYFFVRHLTVIINRAGNVDIGHMFVYICDFVTFIFIFILININVRVGALLYLFSFICYVLIQIFFVPVFLFVLRGLIPKNSLREGDLWRLKNIKPRIQLPMRTTYLRTR